jgi:hypothetical protein
VTISTCEEPLPLYLSLSNRYVPVKECLWLWTSRRYPHAGVGVCWPVEELGGAPTRPILWGTSAAWRHPLAGSLDHSGVQLQTQVVHKRGTQAASWLLRSALPSAGNGSRISESLERERRDSNPRPPAWHNFPANQHFFRVRRTEGRQC